LGGSETKSMLPSLPRLSAALEPIQCQTVAIDHQVKACGMTQPPMQQQQTPLLPQVFEQVHLSDQEIPSWVGQLLEE
jgi:hypothetical protein